LPGYSCGTWRGSARRSGARGGLYKLDESHATRWLGFFLFINVSSGSCRWIRGSHEPNDPRGGNAHPKAGSRRKTFFRPAFFRLRGFLFLRVRGYGEYKPGDPACFCILDGPVWLSAAAFFCSAQEPGSRRGSAPRTPAKGNDSLWNPHLLPHWGWGRSFLPQSSLFPLCSGNPYRAAQTDADPVGLNQWPTGSSGLFWIL